MLKSICHKLHGLTNKILQALELPNCSQPWHTLVRLSYVSYWQAMEHDDVIKWKHFPRYWPFVTGEFPAQRSVTRSFDVFYDLRLNERLRKQSRSWWFKTPSSSSHYDVTVMEWNALRQGTLGAHSLSVKICGLGEHLVLVAIARSKISTSVIVNVNTWWPTTNIDEYIRNQNSGWHTTVHIIEAMIPNALFYPRSIAAGNGYHRG